MSKLKKNNEAKIWAKDVYVCLYTAVSQILNAERSKNDVMFEFQLVFLLIYLFAYCILIGAFFLESLEPSKLHLHSKDSGTLRLWIWKQNMTHKHTHKRLYLSPAVSEGLCQLNTGRVKTPVCSHLYTITPFQSSVNPDNTLILPQQDLVFCNRTERENGTQIAVLKINFLGEVFADLKW